MVIYVIIYLIWQRSWPGSIIICSQTLLQVSFQRLTEKQSMQKQINIGSVVHRFLYFYKCMPLVYRRFKQTTDFRRKFFLNLSVTDSLFFRGVLASIATLYSRIPGLIRGVFGPLFPYYINSHLRFKIFVWNATGVNNNN